MFTTIRTFRTFRRSIMIKIAAIQMCSSHIVDKNLLTAANLIEEAAKNDAKLIVLPEMFAIMGLASTDKITEKEPLGKGKIQAFLSDQAKKNRTWIVGGTIPIECEDMTKYIYLMLHFLKKKHIENLIPRNPVMN